MLSHRYVLFLTEKCNKDCFYCDIGQLENQKEPDPSLLYHFFPLINGKDDIVKKFTLTGGEPALAPVEMLDYIFDTVCKCHIVQVNTNGEFFRKGYFDRWYEKIHYIGYHPSIEVGDDIDPYIVDKKITIYQPIHRKSLKYIKDMCKRYKEVKFNLIPILTKYMFDNWEDYILRKEDYEWLFKELHDLDNIEYSTLFGIYYGSFYDNKTLNMHRQICGNSHIHPTLDFVNKVIRRCPISYTFNDIVPLTDENFIKLMNFNLFRDASYDQSCSMCNDVLRYYASYIPNFVEKALSSFNICKDDISFLISKLIQKTQEINKHV